MSEEYEEGDLVSVTDHKEGVTATVLCGDPMLRSWAEELVQRGEGKPSDFNENEVVDDVDRDLPDNPITVQNGQEKYVISKDRVRLKSKADERETDLPLVTEMFRFQGDV
jgi:hypothetical protein